MSNLKSRNRHQDRRLERHRINASPDASVRIRHGYDRSVAVSRVDADNDNDDWNRCEDC